MIWESWKEVNNFAGYLVSDLGRVWSLKNNRLLRPQASRRGGYYSFINLYREGKRYNVNIHCIVVEAFLGCRPEGYEIDHIDGNRQNPCLDSLEYVTKVENIRRREQRRQNVKNSPS
jgi:hypothetical protein